MLGMLSCRVESSSVTPGKSPVAKENKVMIYPKIYADYQHTSYQSQTSAVSGTRVWLELIPDAVKGQSPLLIILTEAGLTVQLESRLIRLGYDGKQVWEAACDPALTALAHGNNLYFRGIDGDLHGLDERGKELYEEFPIPNCFDLGGVAAVMPLEGDDFLIQTFNRPEEVEEGYPPEKDDYNLMVTGPESGVDWKWLNDFEGKAIPGVATADKTRFALLNDQGQVMVFNVETGERLEMFTVEGSAFIQASLGREDNLVVALGTVEGERKLCSFTLSGELNWEYILPAGTRWSHQPPAIDSGNRVYYIANDILLVIDEGELQWQQQVVPALYRYLTILGDNSVLIVGGIKIDHYDHEGKELLALELEEGEIITAPPVVDNNGRLYIGTVSGIHCLE
jgi:outer membrane protein assembly factor BamB